MIRIASFCKKWNMLPEGERILCAVSGGRDSMALLHLLSAMADAGGFQVAAAHFNHRLRPTADRDEAFVRSWCRDKGVPLLCGGGDVKGYAREAGTGLEDAARVLRYRFLASAAEELGAARIATAHHREDNAETVLLHLLRGAGMQGLCGIPPVRGSIVRPLLEVGRREIDAYVSAHGIPYVEDETNQDAGFTRNRLRLEVLPLLEEIFPGCGARIAGTAALLREENEHLQREADRLAPAVSSGSASLPMEGQLDTAIARRVVRRMARTLGAELDRASVERLLGMGNGDYLDLAGGVSAFRTRDALTLRKQPPPPPPLELREGEQTWGPWRVRLALGGGPVEENACTVVLSGSCGPLTIAAWDGRGSLRVENGGQRTLKRLFADKGVPVQERERHPVLCAAGKPVAVFGVATDWGHRPQEGEQHLSVSLQKVMDENEDG